ncbi:MAG: sel1 repeat family protein [Desulfuromonadaceae bacterium]|nr:sel1 repeat family protein [Desulfuromonadaceae bacterium]
MTSRKRLILNILFFIGCVAIASAAILNNYSYKICWKCDSQDYFERGKEFVCRQDDDLRQTGLDFLHMAVDRGLPAAQILLAESYSNNLPKGYTVFNTNASQCLTGLLGKNQAAATTLFNQAFDQLQQQPVADGALLYNMGLLYENGTLKADNPAVNAQACFIRAADAGNYTAMTRMGEYYHNLADYEQAKKWLRLAAEKEKDAKPALMLGDYFFYGKSETINYEKAIQWYREALKTQQKLWTKGTAEERLAAEDVPRARIDMALRKLQENRMRTPMTLDYRIGGSATHYVVYCQDAPDKSIGTVRKTVEGVVAEISPDIKLSLSIATPKKTFSSMNEGLDWLLNAYARSRYGSYVSFHFRLIR